MPGGTDKPREKDKPVTYNPNQKSRKKKKKGGSKK